MSFIDRFLLNITDNLPKNRELSNFEKSRIERVALEVQILHSACNGKTPVPDLIPQGLYNILGNDTMSNYFTRKAFVDAGILNDALGVTFIGKW